MCAHVLCTEHAEEETCWNKDPACCYDLFEIENGHKIHHGFPLARLKNYSIHNFNHIKVLLPLRKLNYNLYYCTAAPKIFCYAHAGGVVEAAETLSFENWMHSAWTAPKVKSFQINWKHVITINHEEKPSSSADSHATFVRFGWQNEESGGRRRSRERAKKQCLFDQI